MKIFISWSGPRSKILAETLKDWMKMVLQATQPWISSRDKHPSQEGWLSGKKRHHDMFKLLFERSESALRDEAVQCAMQAVLAEAEINNIRKACKSPDWLGYMGLGLFHTEASERRTRKLTKAWVPQILELLQEGSAPYRTLKNILDNPQRVLTWQDLGTVELDANPGAMSDEASRHS